MPFITIKVLEGKTVEQKRGLVQKMSKVVAETFDVEQDKIYIFFEDLKKEDYGKHGDLSLFLENS